MSAEREYVCRACSEPFRTTKTGKGVFYCHRPESDERRAREGVVTRNSRPMRGSAERRAAQARAAEERRERDLAALVMRETHARALRTDRERTRLLARIAAVRKTTTAAAKALQRHRDALHALNVQLATLIGRPALRAPEPAPARLPVSSSEPRRSPQHPTGDLAELIERTQADVLRRSLDPSGDRRIALRRAVVDVANARGAAGMRVALHALAVEALAWEHHLRGGGRELGAAAKDAAA